VGDEDDYGMDYGNDTIGSESKEYKDEDDKPAKRDTSNKKDDSKPIGSPVEQKKEKKGLLKRIFGKKDQ
jgi:hypothetical protein